MDRLPYLLVEDGVRMNQLCQACLSCGQLSIKTVHLYGEPYNYDTLETGPLNDNDRRVRYAIFFS